MHTKLVKSVSIFISAAVIIVGVGFFVIREKDSSNEKNPGGPLRLMSPEAIQLSSDDALFADKNIVFVRDNQLLKQQSSTGEEVAITNLPTSAPLSSVAVSEKDGDVAYVRAEEKQDTLYLVRNNRREAQRVFQARHNAPAGQPGETENAYLRFPAKFITDRYLITRESLWEGCTDHVFEKDSLREVSARFCGSLFWSPDGTRLIEGTAAGFVTDHSLRLSLTGRPEDLSDVNFSTMLGDVSSIFDVTTNTLRQGFLVASFSSPDEVLLLTDLGKLFVYTISTHTIRAVADIGSRGYLAMQPVGHYILLGAYEGIFAFDLASHKLRQLISNAIPENATNGYDFQEINGDVAVTLFRMSENGIVEKRWLFLNLQDFTIASPELTDADIVGVVASR